MNCIAKLSLCPSGYVLNGQAHATQSQGKEALREIYKNLGIEYPKFFKMDTLSRLGFVSSELLLNAEEKSHAMPRFTPREDRAVIVFNSQASLCNDRHYQATIQEADHYFPSPALFVYTLPNIVTGEISIRNKYYGETSCYVLASFQPAVMAQQIVASFLDTHTRSVVVGWVDAKDDANFQAYVALLELSPAEKETLSQPNVYLTIQQKIETILTELSNHGTIN